MSYTLGQAAKAVGMRRGVSLIAVQRDPVAACLSDCSFVPPSFTPRAFARARPSFVRIEIMRRSFSANAA
jgi:hypothetical protein